MCVCVCVRAWKEATVNTRSYEVRDQDSRQYRRKRLHVKVHVRATHSSPPQRHPVVSLATDESSNREGSSISQDVSNPPISQDVSNPSQKS